MIRVMGRFDTLEQKVEKLIDRSLTGVRNNIENGIPVNQETTHKIMEESVAFMQYFRDKKLYIIDTPVCIVQHPEASRRMVDPNLRDTPFNKTVYVENLNFESIYDLVENFNGLLDNEKEIFLYSLDYHTFYDYRTFEPHHRVSVRFAVIDISYWYTPIEEADNGNNLYIPNNNIVLDIKDDKTTIDVVNKLLKHKF